MSGGEWVLLAACIWITVGCIDYLWSYESVKEEEELLSKECPAAPYSLIVAIVMFVTVVMTPHLFIWSILTAKITISLKKKYEDADD